MDTIELGDVTVTRLVELNGRLGAAEEFFPDAPPDAWAPEWLAPDFYEPSDRSLVVPVQTWVLRSAGRTVVVDTGLGDDKDRPQYPPTWHRKRSGYLPGSFLPPYRLRSNRVTKSCSSLQPIRPPRY